MSQSSPESFEDSLLVLQRPTANVDDKLNALRFLKGYVASDVKINPGLVRKINQLVLNSVMELLLKEDHISDQRKKQLIKAECFVLLADLLDSHSMFGEVTTNAVEYDNVVRSGVEPDTESSVADLESLAPSEEFSANPISINDGDADINTHPPKLATSKSMVTIRVPENESTQRPMTTEDHFPPPPNEIERVQQSPTHRPPKRDPIKTKRTLIKAPPPSTPPPSRTATGARTAIGSPSKSGRYGRAGPDISMLNSMHDLTIKAMDARKQKQKKVRPTVFVGDKYVGERLYPGVAPTDWIGQDKKLGYQVSRVWFPVGGDLGADMFPKDRSLSKMAKDGSVKPVDVVEEYLQMKDMMTYVGDLVLPYTRGKVVGRPSSAAGDKKGIDPRQYETAIQQALKVWSPLVGLNVPDWVTSSKRFIKDGDPGTREVPDEGTQTGAKKTRLLTGIGGTVNEFDETQGTLPPPPPTEYQKRQVRKRKHDEMLLQFYCGASNKRTHYMPDGSAVVVDSTASRDLPSVAPPELTNKVLFTKQALKKLLRKELFYKNQSHDALSDTLSILTNNEIISAKTIKQQQLKMGESLAAEKSYVEKEISEMKNLMLRTVDEQYSMLPKRYLLVLEGKSSTSREKIVRGLDIIFRVKHRNLIALAFGLWKIMLVHLESLAKRPQYAKIAAVTIMHGWLQNRKIKTRGLWWIRWKKNVTWTIYVERNTMAIPIQCLYRRWRDRRILLKLDRAGRYDGPLSDIYLRPFNPKLKFSIPKVIRNARRMYWLTAVKIQTKWRSHHQYLIYMVHRRFIILLNSICRMWPKFCYFRRLRHYTIRCQAYGRRTVKYKQYRRLKAATLVVQKYVRRYLCIMKVFRMFQAKFRLAAIPIAPIIFLQCRWRRHLAKQRVKRIFDYRRRREWAALIMQKYWYKAKNAFHTFLLMSCYRVCEEEERYVDKTFRTMGFYVSSRRIGRYYKRRYFKRFISAVVKVQCWFRGCLGYSQVDVLRKIKWASVKLHHWARGMLKYKHKLVRKIQRLWWNSHHGSLLKHLQWRAKKKDLAEDLYNHNRRYLAAARIQGYVHGVWCRRWVTMHRAALKIQRPLRFFLARKRWKREIAERVLRIVKKYVGNICGKCVYNRTQVLIKKHSLLVVRPQSLARGYIVRRYLYEAKQYAFKLGMAARTVQRWWRKTDAFANAVLVVVSLKRMDENPFKTCDTVSELLLALRKATFKYFDYADPRIGLRPNALLHRLGLMELVGMFKTSEYPVVSYMRNITYAKLVKLFKRADEEKFQKAKVKGAKGKYRPAAIPSESFKTLLEVLQPPLYSTSVKAHREILATISPIQEVMSADACETYVYNAFSKKYGKALLARARHTAHATTVLGWNKYTNSKGFVEALTLSQINKAIATTNNSADVRVRIEEMKRDIFNPTEERKWDSERVGQAAEFFQSAAERAKAIFPPGPILDMLEKVSHRLQSYKRKYMYLWKSCSHKSKDSAAKKHAQLSMPGVRKPVRAVSSKINNGKEVEKIPKEMQQSVPSVEDCLNFLPDFTHLGKDEDPQLEYNLSVCRVYSHMFRLLHTSYSGISALVHLNRMHKLRRVVTKRRVQDFLDATTATYVEERAENHVQKVWAKLRRAEKIATQMHYIMSELARKKEEIRQALEWVPVYGWEYALDENGYTYWYDTVERKIRYDEHGDPIEPDPISSYEMPQYSHKQWLMAIAIQKRVRVLLNFLAERRRLKEEAKLRELKLHNAKLALEMQRVRIISTMKYELKSRNLNKVMRSAADILKNKDCAYAEYPLDEEGYPDMRSHNTDQQMMAVVEGELPWRLKFRDNPDVGTGTWVLVKLINGRPTAPKLSQRTSSSRNIANNQVNDPGAQSVTRPGTSTEEKMEVSYEVGVVCHMHRAGLQCDVKNIDSHKYEKVDLKTNIFQMNLDTGTVVEARYKGFSYFYKCRITCVSKNHSGRIVYNVLYEDGERESKVPESYIRVPKETIEEFLYQREVKLKEMVLIQRRREFYARYKAKRILDMADNCTKIQKEFVRTWSYMQHKVTVNPSKHQQDELKYMKSKCRKEPAANVLMETSKKFAPHLLEIGFSLNYTRGALRFGWIAEYDFASGKEVYKNIALKQKSRNAPLYTPEEYYWATKIESVLRMKLAKRRVEQMMSRVSLKDIVTKAIKQYQKYAYIGYKMEGVTLLLLLRRIGLWEVADCIEDHFKGRPQQLALLTPESVVSMKPTAYESIGVFQQLHIRALSLFKEWYHKKSPAERLQDIEFLNYYSSGEDPRSIRSCIADSEDLVIEMFSKAFPTVAARMKVSLGKLVVNTLFPYAKMQVEAYLKRYSGNPGMGQENVYELLGKATTHTWVEEKQAYAILRDATAKIRSYLAFLKLKHMRDKILSVEAKVKKIMATVPDAKEKKRDACSGPEAKAAYLLRTEVMEFMNDVTGAVVILQKAARRFGKRVLWVRLRDMRKKAVTLLQRAIRGFVARSEAEFLRHQQVADWEQLWDDKRLALYYYNIHTGVTTYEEPYDVYRPLVRDRRSAALILAWPQLDAQSNLARLSASPRKPPVYPKGMTAATITANLKGSVCGVCQTRKCVRACLDCQFIPPDDVDLSSTASSMYSTLSPSRQGNRPKPEVYPYCFPCFAKAHTVNEGYDAHKFLDMETGEQNVAGVTTEDDLKPPKSAPKKEFDKRGDEGEMVVYKEPVQQRPMLMCCICTSKLATRKCLSLLSDDDVEQCSSQLSAVVSSKWMGILQKFNLGGDRKINILLKELQGVVLGTGNNNTAPLTNEQQFFLRNVLERTRAECDECYCDGCYIELHSRGKRANHKWLGFKEGAEVCGVCSRSPAEVNCRECDTSYCQPCSRTFHGMGRKRKHKISKLLEELPEYVKPSSLLKAPKAVSTKEDRGAFDTDSEEEEEKETPEISRSQLVRMDVAAKPTYCGLCSRRHADTKCATCTHIYCNSCCECVHKPGCLEKYELYQKNLAKNSAPVCLVCGEVADTKCVQCGDYYCSNTWVGNDGCFVKYHNKGNRATHTVLRF